MNKETYYTMELQGEGSVMAIPDMAVLNLGVETIDMDLKAAQEENATKTQSIISALRRMGIEEKDIRTESYNIEKRYDYVEGRQIDKGYAVTNILEVTLRNIKQAGVVIDVAVDEGANIIRGITFEIEEPALYYQEALNLALDNAVQKAVTLGEQMKVQVFQVPIRITEESSGQVPIGPYYAMREDRATPIEPGQKEILARLKVLFAYYPT